jgi:hypothetical protein
MYFLWGGVLVRGLFIEGPLSEKFSERFFIIAT